MDGHTEGYYLYPGLRSWMITLKVTMCIQASGHKCSHRRSLSGSRSQVMDGHTRGHYQYPGLRSWMVTLEVTISIQASGH
ncbi:hypothetical protein GDO81_029994 [Engystomops pustulosus]|uniref:Uncharacterized protein n=1 Tax=Engystomops pustulosus TaxID=76066 RepID=A0AAV6YHZ2_ENGPU|nr:hypothetical protein GDO81_029994 [Engystomops pustulosus]